ncbi:FkbM family methyltransferase [Silvanigrella aquatica]|uniref:Methyltransferase FkbM domain-containing protein n=1 Tax=Silvanigrella aquatica TaxID=1915309 RepID=A0A1L4D303_9BACT|nr:FkbM family methyltransferase [Silvanigrella aquatica]APJ04580.1 hypothetical protein AXG55_11955 [Silvanigrella aquatica]
MMKQIFRKCIQETSKSFFSKASTVTTTFLESALSRYDISLGDKKLSFYCPNRLTLWRAQTLFSKEPDTIEWINSFEQNSVFYDVGANMGVFSLYAAAKGHRVYSFEPESTNYALLNTNIYINNYSEVMRAYNIALSSTQGFGEFFLSNFEQGAALHNLGESVNFEKKKFIPKHTQGIYFDRLDNFTAHSSEEWFPDYLKIDVDGNEFLVIEGSENIFKNTKLKSILIELNMNLNEDKLIKQKLEGIGFEAQPLPRRTSSVEEMSSVYNFIFKRRK